ncbi:MAG: O-antigen ligase family protein [Actinomycetota bacterium]
MTAYLLDKGPTLRRAILLVTLVGFPLAFLPRLLLDAYAVPKLALLTAGTSLAAAVRLAEIAVGASTRTLRAFLWPALFVTVPLTVSWLVSPYRGWAFVGQYQWFQGLFPYVVVCVFALLLADAFAGRASSVAWALVISAGFVGAYGFAQILGLDPLRLFIEDRFTDSVRSSIGNSNFVGGLMAIAMPAAIGLWIARGSRFRWALVALVFIAESWVFAGSQAAWLAGAAGVIVMLAYVPGRRTSRYRKAAVWLAAAGAAAIVGVTIWGAIDPGNRVIPHTIRVRGRWWSQAVQMAASSPVYGRGPNTFAVEGVAYRSPSDALELGFIFADDPHSLPLSFAANAGLLGGLGYLGLFGWFVARTRRAEAEPMQAIFVGCSTTAFILSLGLVDELTLRAGLFVSLAGLAAAQTTLNGPARPESPRSTRLRWIALLIAAACLAGVWWAGSFLLADAQVKRGVAAFRAGDARRAISEFETALSFRDDYEYRQVYGFELGGAALRLEEGGAPLIEEMRAQFEFVDSFPQVRALVSEARRLVDWSVYDPSARQEALALYQRARAIDPHNPLIAVEISDIYILDGHGERGVALLETFEPRIPFASTRYEKYDGFWGGLALAHLETGREAEALAALDRAREQSGECRVELAKELVRIGRLNSPPPSYEPPLPLVILCRPALLQLLPGS